MKKIFNSLILVLAVSMLHAYPPLIADILGNKHDFHKTIEKEFTITKDALISIDNKYGNIEVKTWEKNVAHFEITLIVNAESKSQSEDIFETFDFIFSDNKNAVSVETEVIEIEKNEVSKWIKAAKKNFKINYILTVPNSVSLDISNKYGAIDIPDMEGDIDVNIKYGSLDLGSTAGNTQMNARFAKISLGEMQDCNIELKSSTLNCTTAKKIVLQSSYSDFHLDNCEKLITNSKYDNFDIGSVKSIENTGKYDNYSISHAEYAQFNTKYAHIKIGELSKRGKFDMKYGGIHIDSFSSDLKEVDINGKVTAVTMKGFDDIAYDLHFDGENVKLKLPDNKSFDIQTNDKQKTLTGKSGSGKSVINIQMDRGILKIQ